jgi:hypothetical protein
MTPYSLVCERAQQISSWASLSHILREHPASAVPYNFLRLCAHRTGERRLRLPEPLPPYKGLYYVQEFGRSCPQQRLVFPNGLGSRLTKDISNLLTALFEDLTPADEDCEGNVVLPLVAS